MLTWSPLPFTIRRSTETIQYLDKTALNYAKVFGMEKAMGLKGQQFAMAASMFYVSRHLSWRARSSRSECLPFCLSL